MKTAEVRFYFDEDLLRLGGIVASLRPDATFPGDPGATINWRTRPACPIPHGAKDTDWVPEVAARGWLIVTRDFNIRKNLAERRAVLNHGAKMVALSGEDARFTWPKLELFMRNWRRVEEIASEPGPFIYLMGASGVRPVALEND